MERKQDRAVLVIDEFENLPYQPPAWDWAHLIRMEKRREREREREEGRKRKNYTHTHTSQNTHTNFYLV